MPPPAPTRPPWARRRHCGARLELGTRGGELGAHDGYLGLQSPAPRGELGILGSQALNYSGQRREVRLHGLQGQPARGACLQGQQGQHQ